MQKVLAIDDEESLLEVISGLLMELIPNCEVLTASSGSEGLEKAKSEHPDTILLDVKMPGMDGFEVCERLKADKDTERIPVVMLSGIQTDVKSRIKAFESGAIAFMSKPIVGAEIAAQVQAALRIKRAEDILLTEKGIVEDMVDGRTDALHHSEEKYRLLLNTIPQRIFYKDRDLVYVGSNLHFAKSFDLKPEEIAGKTDYDLFPENLDLAEKYRMDDRIVMESGVIKEIEENFMKDKQEVFLKTLKTPIVEDGKITGILGISWDISTRKRLEAQLRHAQKMEAVGTLAGGIAHDFNNILMSIVGYAQLADIDTPEGSPAKADLKEVLNGAHRAKELVKQIISFGLQQEEEPKPMWISPVIKEALKLLRVSLPSTIEIRERIEVDNGIAKADPTQIHQVFLNLCTNASHAMRDEGGILDVTFAKTDMPAAAVSLHPVLPPGPYLRLSVTDTGCGMPPEVVERIFDPYFTTKEKGEGTGLGLSITHGIIKKYGGAIEVLTEPGKGSTFNVYLPRITRRSKQNKSETESIDRLSKGDERILFVDDEQDLVEIGRRTLKRLGYDVVTRTSSLRALSLFKEQPDQFDLVITDTTMPDMTGSRLAEEMLRTRPDIPIILCTGYSEDVSEKRAKEMGVKAFVMKPVTITDLAKIVRKVLDEK